MTFYARWDFLRVASRKELPYYALLKYMQPQGVWFLSSFDLEKVIKDFDHIVSQRNRLKVFHSGLPLSQFAYQEVNALHQNRTLVLCLVTWPAKNASKAGGDLALIQTSLLFLLL